MGSSPTKEVSKGTAVAVPVGEVLGEISPARRQNRLKRRKYGVVDSNEPEDDKLYCLMLTLLALCGAGVLVCVLVAGIIYASQTGGG